MYTYSGVRFLTSWSLEFGIIPKRCPICNSGIFGSSWVLHHWGEVTPNKATMESGRYRRICFSCNQTLRRIFKDSYPEWPEQLEALVKYKALGKVKEGWWSLPSKKEEDKVVKELSRCNSL